MNILDQCCTAIEKNPAHYIDLRVKPVDDLSDPETTPFRVYYETAAGDRYFTKPTAASLAEFAKLAESGTITRSQFETFAYHAVNSPLPNENFTDLNALADTLRKALDEGTQIIL